MSVRSAQSITACFTTSSFATGAATDADSLPTGTLYVNGTANGASVTVTNISTGLYKAAVTLPTLAVGDLVEIGIAATVGAVAGKGVIWRDTKDVVIDSAGLVDSTTVKVGPTGAATAQTAGDLAALIANLTSSGVSFVSPVADSGNVTIIRGDDYLNTDSRALNWTSDGWPNLTSATISVTFRSDRPSEQVAAKTGSVVTAGAGDQTVRLEMTDTETAALTSDRYSYAVTATLSNADVVTLVQGTMTVNARTPRP